MGGGTITYSYRAPYFKERYQRDKEKLNEQRRRRNMVKKFGPLIPEIVIDCRTKDGKDYVEQMNLNAVCSKKI
jgi:hypothetical protein